MKTLGFGIAAFVLIVDQLSKYGVLSYFENTMEPSKPLMPFVELALRYNAGISFSLLRQRDTLGVPLLTLFALSVVVGLGVWLVSVRDRGTAAALGLIMGGALGNALDRARLGVVVDFLDFHIFSWHVFVFNGADAAISLGVALLIALRLTCHRQTTAL